MRLWIPGPTQVRPELLAECARPMIGHRSKAMTQLVERLDPHLTHAFGLGEGSTAQLAAHTVSATGFMESCLIGCGPRVLSLVTGAFGARWHEIAERLGKQARALEAPWGECVPPAQLRRVLSEEGPFDALTFISSETSTGTLAPLDAYAALLREFEDTLVFVDLVSYLAAGPVDFDARGFDFAFAGTQKALALPPGLAVACASQRYLEQARTRANRGFYLDPVEVFEGHAARKTPSTPCIPLYYALARQVEDISAGLLEGGARDAAEGWRKRFERHARMRSATESWAAARGLEYLPASESRSPAVACVRAGGLDVGALLAGLEARGHKIGNGYGKLKDATFRIGHMGDHLERDLAQLLAAADQLHGG
ncbi:MAG TPA: aminotransferase class V-fold PLP-dependent enzyme [Planctomycetota bacterium]|nr:aminotransferase class V-fold PLP-dependent enzyme [Planctomycetota bacterium]